MKRTDDRSKSTLATLAAMSDEDLEDFVSYLTNDADRARFWERIAEARRNG